MAAPKLIHQNVVVWPDTRGTRYVPTKTSIAPSQRNGIHSIVGIKRVHRVDDLGEIVLCLRAPGLVLDCFERGKEQANQNRDDSDDDQELNESKSERLPLGWTHGANASRKLSSAHVKSLKKLHRYKGLHPLLGKPTPM